MAIQNFNMYGTELFGDCNLLVSYLELEGFGVGDVNGGYLVNLLAHLVRHIVPGTQREGQRLCEPALIQSEKKVSNLCWS
jgi:hypothetical protein